jgi:hypothetical protein
MRKVAVNGHDSRSNQGDLGPMLWFFFKFRRKKLRLWLKITLNYSKVWS